MRGLRFEITANSLVDLLSLLIAAKVRTRAIGSLSLPALPHEKFYGQELEIAELECEFVGVIRNVSGIESELLRIPTILSGD